VTLAKMANLAQDQFIGRTTASTGVPETATITAAARTLLDDTTVLAMQQTLGIALTIPAADHTATGPSTSAFNLGATIALMDLVYLGSASKWLLTDADAAATATGMLGICLAGGVDTNATVVALSGSFVRDDTWNWTPGAILYVDTAVSGGITATAPSGTDDVVRVIGHAVTADVIYFLPLAWLTHV